MFFVIEKAIKNQNRRFFTYSWGFFSKNFIVVIFLLLFLQLTISPVGFPHSLTDPIFLYRREIPLREGALCMIDSLEKHIIQFISLIQFNMF